MRSHLPRDSTRSTVWPASGVSSLKRVRSGYVDRKPMMGLPMRARPNARAVRKMVSPSGIELLNLTGMRLVRRLPHRKKNAAQVHAERTSLEACIHKEMGHGMSGDRLAVDGGDEHSLVSRGPHALLTTGAEK